MDADKLEYLNRLYRQGKLTDAEYDREKRRLAGEPLPPGDELPLGLSASGYLALMNFAMLFTSAGWIVSIILWVIAKNKSVLVDMQGKYIVNWIITWGIVLIGFLFFFLFDVLVMLQMSGGRLPWSLYLFLIYGAISVCFPIIGGIQGLRGKVWRYPLSIPFFK